MRVYLDNCCYNRPFDDQSQVRVRVETISKLAVQLMMATRRVEYVWSSTLDYELSRNPVPKRRTAIARWRANAVEYVTASDDVSQRARELEDAGLGAKDALHVASAEQAGCDWFLTTDKGILKRASVSAEMRIANPTTFIVEAANADDR